MIATLVYAVPLAIIFMTLSDQWSLGGLVTGMVLGAGIVLLLVDRRAPMRPGQLPSQLFWLLAYVARLALDILLSGIDVARRVLSPRLNVNPGELEVSTQDPANNMLISALSAHAITTTPGEVVEDFAERSGQTTMLVHALEVDASAKSIHQAQTRRLRLLRRIHGDANT